MRQIIYTDGSLPMTKKGYFGGIGAYFGKNDKRNISEPFLLDKTTSPRCELFAIIRAIQKFLETTNTYKLSPKKDALIIYCDNQYVVNSMNTWAFGWREKGWKKSNGNPIENPDLIKWLFNLIGYIRKFIHFELHWVKAHRRKIPPKGTIEYNQWYGNNQADLLAQNARK